MKWYLCGRYDRHPEMNEFAQVLRTTGDQVTCEWITGVHSTEKYKEATQEEFAVGDLKDLFDADGLIQFGDDLENVNFCSEELDDGSIIQFVPAKWATGGRHVEFGIALCLRILHHAGVLVPDFRIVLVDHRQNIFHHLSKFVEFYESTDTFLDQRRRELYGCSE